MLKQRIEEVQPWIFSASDGALYPYQWSKNPKQAQTEAERLERRFTALDQRQFEAAAQAWNCDRCPVRISCPLWMGVAGEPSSGRLTPQRILSMLKLAVPQFTLDH